MITIIIATIAGTAGWMAAALTAAAAADRATRRHDEDGSRP